MARPGQILGIHFKSAIGSMLTTRMLFPEVKQTVDAMDDNGWYPWDLYVDMTRKIAAELPAETVISVGKKNIVRAKQHFIAQGFDSTEKILKDWASIFNQNLRGTPREDLIRTVEFEPGRVTIEAGVAHVPQLVEGYMRGFVEIFGNVLTSFSSRPIKRDGKDYHRFDMTWRPAFAAPLG